MDRHRGLEPRSLQQMSFALPDELMAVRRLTRISVRTYIPHSVYYIDS